MVLDLQDTLVGIYDPKIDDGGHAGGYVVAGYYLLGRHLHRDCSEVYLDHPVYYRKEDEEPWSFGPSLYPTEPKNHTPLVLLDDLDGAEYDRDDEYRDNDHRHSSHQSYPNRLQQA